MLDKSAKDEKGKSEIARPARPAAEIIEVPAHADEVMCDGGHDILGHPQVWYSFDGAQEASCYYCGRKFVKAL